MKVIELLKKKKTLSFEFFPPKTVEQESRLFGTIAALKKFNPDFVSVTYGAMGTTRERTFFWVEKIKKEFQIEPVAHLTCVAADRTDIQSQLEQLKKMGVENVLALRGDPPAGENNFIPPANGFHYAKELIAFIREKFPAFCLGAAGFPEGHINSPGLEKDTEYLQQKIAAGAQYVITQLFFDNKYYFSYLERLRKAGITAPIIPGIILIANFKQTKKIARPCGATIPKKLLEELEKHQNDPEAVRQIGIEQAAAQCEELLKANVPGLHFFVMNQAEPTSTLLLRLRPALSRSNINF